MHIQNFLHSLPLNSGPSILLNRGMEEMDVLVYSRKHTDPDKGVV
jgi:hypothetical protein